MCKRLDFEESELEWLVGKQNSKSYSGQEIKMVYEK